MRLIIRRAEAADAEIIADHNCALAWETEQVQLPPAIVLAGVRTGLRQAPEVRYFVAELNGAVVGQLMFSREWSDWRNGWIVWLQSVYVSTDHRQQGVFRQLFEESVAEIVREDSPVCLRLYVEQQNKAASSCYERLGFAADNYRVMEKPMRAATADDSSVN